MSTPATSEAMGVGSVSRAHEPSWVRQGSAQVQQSYAAALAFEQTLVEQLAKTMLAGDGPGAQSEGEAGGEESAAPSDAGSGLLSSLLPQALAGGISAKGGFGLAAELTRGLAGASERAAGSTTAQSGGASAPSTAASSPTGGSSS